MSEPKIPTVAQYAGGLGAFERLTNAFYTKVMKDPILQPVFAQMGPTTQSTSRHSLPRGSEPGRRILAPAPKTQQCATWYSTTSAAS
jgi:hypothetical protein